MSREIGDTVKFGKHSGKTWFWVLTNDPKYIEWLYVTFEGWSINGLTVDDIEYETDAQPEWSHYESD